MITHKAREQERLSRCLSDEMPKEHDGPFREKLHNREQPDGVVPGSPEHAVAPWTTL